MARIFSRTLSLLFLLTFFVSLSSAGWELVDDYNPSNFFSKFSFWTWDDPTHGHVKYVDQATATKAGLIKRRNGGIYMGVDYTNKAPQGRQSVRLTSYAKYNTGTLMILDLKHMPVGCGTWPAYWSVGPNWPRGGEIDIIEGVHKQDHNAMTLHTGPGFSINPNPLMTGSIVTPNCDINAPGQWSNAGCSIATAQKNTYGNGLNKIQGGVYAMAWQKDSIRVWFFPRGAIPADINSGKPLPAKWGKPLSLFTGSCNIPQFFKDNQIVFDTTFCGDWAGAVWDNSGCKSAKYPTCESFVSNNPAAFKNAFWQINYLKVYGFKTAVSNPPPKAPSSSSAYVPVTTASNNNNNNKPPTNNKVNNNKKNKQQQQQQNRPNNAVKPNIVSSLLVIPSSNPVRNKGVAANPAQGKAPTNAPSAPQGQTQTGPRSSGVKQPSSSTAKNVVVGADGVLMLGGFKSKKRAAAVQEEATAPPAMRLEEREAPVEERVEELQQDEDGEEVNEEVVALLQREKKRRARHARHLARHVRPVGLREGVFLH